MKSGSIVIIGSATIDTIVQDASTFHKIGGVATYGGITFRRHGLDATVLSNIAATDTAIFDLYRNYKIRLFNGLTPTTTCFVNYRGQDNKRRQEITSKAAPITISEAKSAFDNTDHIHLGPLHPHDIEPASLAHLPRYSRFISLDVQGYVRHIENTRVMRNVSHYLQDALLISNVIKAEEQELEAILNTYQMDTAEFKRQYDLDELVITAGSAGGSIITASGENIGYKPLAVERIVDTTGAGDVFFAAYLASRFHHHKSVSEASRHASFIAAQYVEGSYIPLEILEL